MLPRPSMHAAITSRARPSLGGSLVGVWNGWGYGIAFFRALNFQISEPEFWRKSLSLRNFRDFPGNFGPEKYFSDSGKWPFHIPRARPEWTDRRKRGLSQPPLPRGKKATPMPEPSATPQLKRKASSTGPARRRVAMGPHPPETQSQTRSPTEEGYTPLKGQAHAGGRTFGP